MKLKLTISAITIATFAIAQPTGSPPTAFPGFALPQVRDVANSAWYRGGNTPGGPAGFNNIFGTMWNSRVYHYTDGFQRMQVGHLGFGANLQNYAGFTNPLPGNRLTRIGISRDGANPIVNPLSLIHVGYGTPFPFGTVAGYRSWQDIGTMYMASSDNFYVGLRQKNPADPTGRTSAVLANPTDAQDAVITWGDNYSGAGPAPDNNLAFIFHAPLNTTSGNMASSDYGLEVMRMNGDGRVGIGPRFGDNFPPQSTLHQHQQNSQDSWMQITNQASPILNNPPTVAAGPTAIGANDGLRWGINPDNTAYIYNQENKPLLFSTNYNAGSIFERLRITHIGEPGTPNPGSFFANNMTRVAISHNPTAPINRPLALLHLGYNTGFVGGPPGITDGWRNWMDVGTFTSNSTDHLYSGLKPELTFGTASIDRQDAVIGWGDNYQPILPGINTGPDKMRVIFTSPIAGAPGAGPGAMSTQNGLEFVRYVPFHNLSLNVNDPRIGFGDFNNLLPVGTIDPRNTVEINSIMNGPLAPADITVAGSYVGSTGASGLRFTDLTKNSTVVPSTNPAIDVTKVLTVDNDGNVVLINGGGGTALGNLCSAAPAPLLGNYQIEMTPAFNFNYTMPALSTSQVNIGQVACATNPARLYVENDNLITAGSFLSNANNPTVLYGSYSKSDNTGLGNATGVYGEASCPTINNNMAIGVHGVAGNSITDTNIGVFGSGTNGISQSFGGYFESLGSSSFSNVGINANVSTSNPSSITYGVLSNALGFGAANYGGYFVAAGTGDNYGIYAQVAPSPLNWAGYFDDKVFINGGGVSSTGLIFSDQNIKENVQPFKEQESIDLLNKLNPVTYNLNNTYAPQLNVNTDKTYGLIAQQVALVIPELVKDVIVPAKRDSLGAVINPSVTIKTLNYDGLIPITINAIKHLDQRQNGFQSALNQAGLSDALIKTGVSNFNALAKIKTLNPVTYTFTNASVPQLNLSNKQEYGFIAQQLETVYPELVDTVRIPAKLDSLGAVLNPSKVLKTVNYKAMNGLLVRAIQEQQSKIDSLISVTSKQDSINAAVANQIATLTTLINSCCSNASARTNNSNTNSLDVELSDKDAIVLDQNVPNPFAEQTTITYNVPASVTKAQILFYNATGQLIQTVDIKTRGKGKVNVFASDLSSGLYHYSLVADGKIIDSKKMVRE